MHKRRFRFQLVELLWVTAVLAVAVATAKEGLLYGPQHSPILLVGLASGLGAVTSRVVSGSYCFGLVGGLLFGVLGFRSAVLALSLGVNVSDEALCFIGVGSGGVIGGIIGGLFPTMVHWWRRASSRKRLSILLAGACLLIALGSRWWVVHNQLRVVEDLRAAGAFVDYSDVSRWPKVVDATQMDPRTEWLRKLLGLRVVARVHLMENVDQRYAVQVLVDELPSVQDLSLYAEQVDEKVFEVLNSGRLPRLDHLRFTGRGFGDTSLSRLQPLPGIVLLDLEGTSVTDNSIEHIIRFPQLGFLSVRDTDVTADGVQRLKSKIGRVWSSN